MTEQRVCVCVYVCVLIESSQQLYETNNSNSDS